MSDPVDDAIAAAQQPAQQQLRPITIAGTGRIFAIPPDITIPEMVEISAWLTAQALGRMQQAEQAARPSIVLATPSGPVALKRN